MARLVVLATGGTIAGQQCHGGYRAAAMSGQALLQPLGLSNLGVDVMVEDIASIGSQDMNEVIWHRLASRIQALAHEPAVTGVVITHGTDTLEETAFFLACVLDVPFHVVLTGAMRPADAADADGPANLRHALMVAAQPVTPAGTVLVCMAGAVHAAAWVKKVDASALMAFASPGAGAVAQVLGDTVYWTAGLQAATLPRFALPDSAQAWPRIGIIWAHAGLQVAQVQALLALHWEGWVLAGVGNGNAPQDCLLALRQAAAAGSVVVRARRCLTGWVSAQGEVDDAAFGFLVAGRYDALQARILLMLALPWTHDRQARQAIFA